MPCSPVANDSGPARPREVSDLVRAQAAGAPLDYLFFWGHTPRPDGTVGPPCLSQWWPAPLRLGGREFAGAEHYMMWRKAVLFDDLAVAEAILATTDPSRAKALGRRIAGFTGPTWAAERFDAVVTGNAAKFGQHPELGRYLLGTGGRVLVEASPDDDVWGIGLAASHPDASRPDRWPGTNLLGFALMEVRDRLRGRG